MKFFTLSKKNKENIQKILNDYDLDEKSINYLFNYDENELDYIEFIDDTILKSESSMSLFSGDNKFVQNIVMATLFKDRVKEIEEMEYVDYLKIYENENIDYSREYQDILNGHYVVNILKKDFINLDWKKYGFNAADEMYYALGAFFCNVIHSSDQREIKIEHTNSKYQTQDSFYGNHIHGDFRFSQYDISETSILNPFNNNELLPFGRPKLIGNLSGYHSVEHLYLIGLLSLALNQKMNLPILDSFDAFFEELYGEGQSFGNYSDAGVYSKSMSLSAFACIELNVAPNIPKEHRGSYKAVISDNKLTYLFDDNIKAVIYPEMLNELIIGLFYKVSAGNGRSSIQELKDCILFFKEKYYKK